MVECPKPPGVRNAEKTSHDHNYLAVVTYYCTGGMRFEDGHTLKSIKCIDPGVWNDSVNDCASTCNTSILSSLRYDTATHNVPLRFHQMHRVFKAKTNVLIICYDVMSKCHLYYIILISRHHLIKYHINDSTSNAS